MPEKIQIELGKVQETLLLPLWGRAVETQKENPRLTDTTALEILNKIDYDFSIFEKNLSFIIQYTWIARALHIDNTIKEYLKNNPFGIIINIGCGLDTTFSRIDNGSVQWFDIDLPDVMELRKKFIQTTNRQRSIITSFLEKDWLNEFKKNDYPLLIAGGVFYYFEENQIKNFFIRISDKFLSSELLFDIASPLGVKVSNEKVLKSSGMDDSSVLKWGIKKAKDMEKWDDRIKVLKEFPMFRKMKKGFSLKGKYGLFMADCLKIMSLVHLRIG
ncbi:MAG: class I SAM-dependent methyltransferase [bacterium]